MMASKALARVSFLPLRFPALDHGGHGGPHMKKYVGFRKSHPHDTNSTIRVALSNKSEGGEGTVRTLVAAACGTGLRIMHGIEQAF